MSNPHLKVQCLASCRWTTPEWMGGGANGYRPHYSWLEATRVSVNTLTPKSSRRVLAPRPSRWQQGALPLSYYCLEAPAGVSPASPGLQPGTCILGHGARAAEEGLEPPTTVVNGHPLSRLSYSAKARTGSRHAPGGSHAGFPCVLSTAGRCLQDGPSQSCGYQLLTTRKQTPCRHLLSRQMPPLVPQTPRPAPAAALLPRAPTPCSRERRFTALRTRTAQAWKH